MTALDVSPLRDTQDAFAPTGESVLSFADGTPVDELRARVLLAMRYTFSWQKALSDAGSSISYGVSDPLLSDLQPLQARVAAMQTSLSALLDALPPNMVFPGNREVATYNAVSAVYAQLYRDLATAVATLPQRALIDQLGDVGSAIFQAPGAVAKTLAEQASQSIRDLLGGTAAAIWSHLWPVFLIGGAAGIVYLFRAPLLAVVRKVTA